MTVYLAFNENEALNGIFSNSLSVPTTGTGVALAGINRAGLTTIGFNAGFATCEFTPISEGWFHTRYVARSGSSGAARGSGTPFRLTQLLDTANAAGIFRIFQTSADNNIYFSIPNISGPTITIAPRITCDIDVHFKVAIAGFVKCYVDGSLVYSFFGDTTFASGDQNVNDLRLQGMSVGQLHQYSQVLISDKKTIRSKIYTLPLSATISNDWTGTLVDINDTTRDDTTFIYTEAINDTIIFDQDLLPSLNINDKIETVVLSLRGLYEPDSPVTSLELVLNDGATTVDTGITTNLTEGFSSHQLQLEQNPFSGVPEQWTVSNLNSLNLGLKAKA